MTQFIELTLLNEESKMLIKVDKIEVIDENVLGGYVTIYVRGRKRRGKLVPCRVEESYAEIKKKLKWLLVEEEKEIL